MPSIAFIDLLATKDSALVGDDEFLDAMDDFHEALLSNKSILGGGAKLRHFADCCYIESADLTNLLKYLRAVRHYLFEERRFFKCSVGLGSLDEKSVKALDQGGQIDGIDVGGSIFGPDVAKIYLAVERFKGVGIFIAPDAANSLNHQDKEKFLSYSAFFSSDENTALTRYTDLKFVDAEIDEGSTLVQEIIQVLGQAKSVKEKYAKYYFPTLMLWINSYPVSTSDIEHQSDDESILKSYEFAESKKLYRFFFGRGDNSFYKKFPDMPQYSALYLAILQRFITIGIETSPLEFVIRKIPAPSKVFKATSKVPDFVISKANRSRVARLNSKIRL